MGEVISLAAAKFERECRASLTKQTKQSNVGSCEWMSPAELERSLTNIKRSLARIQELDRELRLGTIAAKEVE
jgi:hypothetical protein